METVPAKSIISSVKPTDDYIYRDYNMNIYRGCSHGCIYCDSRSLCYQVERFDCVRAKENALALIEKELRAKRKAGIIATGAMSDPYNPFEEREELTRGALLLIRKYGFGVSVTTKAALVARDADVLGDIMHSYIADVRLTITTSSDELAAKIEPGVSSPSERFEALRTLSAAGVYTGVFITPVLPYVTDAQENILEIVERAADCGARNVVCMMGMTLRAGNREYYYAGLDRHFPELKSTYQKRYGERYVCTSPKAKQLWAAFANACEKRGLLYEFKSINRAIKDISNKQVSMF